MPLPLLFYWALIFILRSRFPSGELIADVLTEGLLSICIILITNIDIFVLKITTDESFCLKHGHYERRTYNENMEVSC